jgi:hypothetical protein
VSSRPSSACARASSEADKSSALCGRILRDIAQAVWHPLPLSSVQIMLYFALRKKWKWGAAENGPRCKRCQEVVRLMHLRHSRLLAGDLGTSGTVLSW